MTAPAALGQFVETLQQSGLFERSVLDAYLRQPSTVRDPDELARNLIRDGLLTEFQARQLLAGKCRGFILGGRYKVLDQIGAGGMAGVYLCEHLATRQSVALKVLPPQQAKDPVALERFRREARAVSLLNHPNIVRAFETGQDGDLHFLALEHVQGTDLQKIVQRGPMQPSQAASCILQAALGLQHAHEAGLVHRDIKPANLLIDPTGTIKVLDLGLARFFNDDKDNLTQEHDSQAILGTADYLAPEQAVDSHDVDIRADIYSLGCTFYFLLAGHAPFHGKTVTQKLIHHQTQAPEPIRTRRREVPREMAAVLDRMMAKSPTKRYQTPGEVAAALSPWGQSPPPGAAVLAAPGDLFKKRRAARERRYLWLTIGGAVVLLGGVGLFLMLLFRSPPPEPVTMSVASEAAPDESASLQRGLRDQWKFNEGTGNIAKSSVPGGVNCELKDGASWEPAGARGSGIRLRGPNNYLNFMTEAYEVGPTFTLAAWVNLAPEAKSGQVVMANRHGGPAKDGFVFYINSWDTNNRALVFETGNGKEGGAVISVPEVVSAGKWQHVAVAYQRSTKTVRLFANGAEVATTGSSRHDFSTRAVSHIGVFPGGGGWFVGVLDDVRLYSRALSNSEVAALAKLGSGR